MKYLSFSSAAEANRTYKAQPALEGLGVCVSVAAVRELMDILDIHEEDVLNNSIVPELTAWERENSVVTPRETYENLIIYLKTKSLFYV